MGRELRVDAETWVALNLDENEGKAVNQAEKQGTHSVCVENSEETQWLSRQASGTVSLREVFAGTRWDTSVAGSKAQWEVWSSSHDNQSVWDSSLLRILFYILKSLVTFWSSFSQSYFHCCVLQIGIIFYEQFEMEYIKGKISLCHVTQTCLSAAGTAGAGGARGGGNAGCHTGLRTLCGPAFRSILRTAATGVSWAAAENRWGDGSLPPAPALQAHSPVQKGEFCWSNTWKRPLLHRADADAVPSRQSLVLGLLGPRAPCFPCGHSHSYLVACLWLFDILNF